MNELLLPEDGIHGSVAPDIQAVYMEIKQEMYLIQPKIKPIRCHGMLDHPNIHAMSPGPCVGNDNDTVPKVGRTALCIPRDRGRYSCNYTNKYFEITPLLCTGYTSLIILRKWVKRLNMRQISRCYRVEITARL